MLVVMLGLAIGHMQVGGSGRTDDVREARTLSVHPAVSAAAVANAAATVAVTGVDAGLRVATLGGAVEVAGEHLDLPVIPAAPVAATPIVPPRTVAVYAASAPAVAEVAAAIAIAFPIDEQREALTVALCETGADPSNAIIDTNGQWSEGAWDVQPRWWGAVVLGDALAQARQVADIVQRFSWAPWSCASE